MKTYHPLILIFTLIFLTSMLQSNAQYSPFYGPSRLAPFYGISPYIHKAPGMGQGEYELNIFPLTQIQPISTAADFRSNTYLNLHINNPDYRAISSYGFDLGVMFYTKGKLDRDMPPPSCFYLAPVARIFFIPDSQSDQIFDLFLLLEPGYHVNISNIISLTVSAEMGVRRPIGFNSIEYPWNFHISPRIMAGVWLNL